MSGRANKIIPREHWPAIKSRLRRKQAFTSRAADRSAIRTGLKFLELNYPDLRKVLHVLPISTMQWSSVVIGRSGVYVAFVDIEQANALELLLLRGFWSELPIMSHAEFMIRAAEVSYDNGDLALAASLTERANKRLKEYSERVDGTGFIPRPKVLNLVLNDILSAKIVLNFILGHEVGHLVQLSSGQDFSELFDWIAEQYKISHEDRTTTPIRERFLLPEIIQKFNDQGQAAGHAIQGTKFASQFPALWKQQIKECQADAIGVLLATNAAIQAGVPSQLLFGIVFSILEYTEMLMTLRRLLPWLPRGKKRSAIPLEKTSLVARLIMFVRLIRGLRDRTAPVPAGIRDYWSALPEEVIVQSETQIDSGQIEQFALRNQVIVRGGIEVALQGALTAHQSVEELVEMLGGAAGGLVVAQAHRGFPEAYYRIEESFEWHPESEMDSVLYGLAGAIRDICEITASEDRPIDSIRQADILTEGGDADFTEFLRSSRTQIVRMGINDNWPGAFEHLLRNDPVTP